MRCLTLPGKARLYCTSCWHVGNSACRYNKISELIERVRKDKNAYWIHLGDLIEAISPTDPRFNPVLTEESIMEQFVLAFEYIQKAKDNFIGILYGNHEYKLSSLGNVLKSVSKLVFKDACKYLGGVLQLNLKYGTKLTKVLLGHSDFEYPRTVGDVATFEVRQQNRLRRWLSHWHGDVKLIGHAHHCIIAPPVTQSKLDFRDSTLKYAPYVVDPAWAAVCPSMFVSYDDLDMPTYAEMKMLPPTEIGYLIVHFNNDGKVKTIEPVLS